MIHPSRSEVFKKYFNNSYTVAEILKTSSEDSEQVRLFKTLDTLKKSRPLLDSIHHIPNGSNKSKAQAGLFKALGQKAGVWDVHAPIPRFGRAGLYIEMKWTSTLSKEQKNYHDMLKDYFFFAVCYSGEQAADVIKAYLGSDTEEEFREKCII